MAYTKKPSQVPAGFDFPAFLKLVSEGKPIPLSMQQAAIAYRHWQDSTFEYDGDDKGGLRDTLNAGLYGVDGLKTAHDQLDDREASHWQQFLQFKAEQEAHAHIPFPASG